MALYQLTGVVATRVWTSSLTTTMVRSNGNRTLTVILSLGLLKLETRYGTVIAVFNESVY